MSKFKIQWVDGKREPSCAPDPAFPKGKHIALPPEIRRGCKVDLPYPAKRCGYFVVHCKQCETTVIITTAGRPDDPCSADIPCEMADNTLRVIPLPVLSLEDLRRGKP